MIPLRVEVAETGTVWQVLHGETLTWTDITDWLLFAAGVEFDRGMGAEDDVAKPGQATFTCQTLPDGTVAPLKVRRPVRISGYISDVWQVLWTGSISGWRQGWAKGVRGVQQVVCSDNISVAERITMESIPVETILDAAPVWCVPLDDSFEGTPREVTGGDNLPQFVARQVGLPDDDSALTSGWWSPGSTPGVPESSVAWFEGDNYTGGWCLDADSPTRLMPLLHDTGGYTLSVFVFLTAHETERVALSVASETWGGQNNLDIGVDGWGRAFVKWAGVIYAGTSILQTGQWHHIAFGQDYGTAGRTLTVNGEVEHSSIDSFTTFGLGTWRIRIGASLAGTSAWSGGIANVAAFTPVLPHFQTRAIAATRDGFVGETTGARFYRLANLAGLLDAPADMGTLATPELGNVAGWTTFWSTAGVWSGDTATVEGGEVASLFSDPIGLGGTSAIAEATVTLSDASLLEWQIVTGKTAAQADYFQPGVGIQTYRAEYPAGTHTVRIWFRCENPAHGFARANFRITGQTTQSMTVDGGGIFTFAGIGTMGVQPTKGKSAAAVLQDCADVESAPWGSTADGLLRIASRGQRCNRLAEGVTRTWAAVEADGVTWAELGSVTGGWVTQDIYLPAEAVDPSTSAETRDARIVNRVTATRPGGITYVAQDAASITDYGRYAQSLDLAAASDAQVTTRADWEVATNSAPKAEMGTLAVDIVACGASVDVAAVLAAQSGYLAFVSGLPDDAPANDLTFFVEGTTDRVTPSSWVRTFNTTQAPASTAATVVGDLVGSGIPIGL